MFGILLLILLNLAMGYGLAVYFHRPELFAIAWRFMPTALPPVTAVVAPVALSLSPQQAVVPEAVNRSGSPPSATESATNAIQPAALASDTAPRKSQTSTVPTESIQADRAIASITDELRRYCSQLGEIDQQISEHSDEPNSGYVQAYVEKFGLLSDGYLEQQERHLESIRKDADKSIQSLAEPCAIVVKQQSAVIASTRDNLVIAAALAGPAAACRAFLEATNRLAEANQTMRAELDRTLENADLRTRHSNSEQRADPANDDPANLERAVAEFIGNQANVSEKFSVALVEVDQLAEINRQQGRAVSDRILDAIVKTFVALGPRSTLAADKDRQQLLYFQADTSARETTGGVEQVRQRIHAAAFQHGNSQLQVTLSCAVADATCDEAPAVIVKRLQDILREAQRYGRNRTFFQEGQHSAPAIPPAVNVEKRIIEV